jgi:hypothetical protein
MNIDPQAQAQREKGKHESLRFVNGKRRQRLLEVPLGKCSAACRVVPHAEHPRSIRVRSELRSPQVFSGGVSLAFKYSSKNSIVGTRCIHKESDKGAKYWTRQGTLDDWE